MRLYAVQHGEAVDKAVDPERPLSGRGRRDVERLAAFLARQDLRRVQVVHSGKTRAAQTAELLAWAVRAEPAAPGHPGLGPEDPVEPWVEALASREDDLLLVGHLPFLDRLVSALTAGSPEAGVARFVPGTAACLERVEPGAWRLVWLVPPEVLATEE
ncbi:MAG: phosphohistidine phosphatase SixA [Deferrisomatales bacterium]